MGSELKLNKRNYKNEESPEMALGARICCSYSYDSKKQPLYDKGIELFKVDSIQQLIDICLESSLDRPHAIIEALLKDTREREEEIISLKRENRALLLRQQELLRKLKKHK